MWKQETWKCGRTEEPWKTWKKLEKLGNVAIYVFGLVRYLRV